MKESNLFMPRILLIIFFSINLLYAIGQNSNNQLPIPTIKAGIAKISGRISNLKLPDGEKKASISIAVYNPVTGKESDYAANLNENNRFSFDVPLECSTAMVGFNVQSETKFYGNAVIGLDPTKNLQLNIVFDDKGDMKTDIKEGLQLSSEDIMNTTKAISAFEQHSTWGDYYKMTPKEFSKHELKSLKERISFAIDSLHLSDEIKKYLINSFNLRYISGRIFDYKEVAKESYRASTKDSIVYEAVEPDKSFYSFLKDFNLNDPQFLYTYSYSDFMHRFLSIDAFKIPKIKDTPINQWLIGVKSNIKDFVGFNSGLFYDMLAVSAYNLQLNYRMEPLTNKQVENIKEYYITKNRGIADILLKNNEEIIKTLEKSKDLKVNVTPSVAKEKLMDAILSKYKGKVVLVDFWETWCGPCLRGIKEMKPFKNELKNKEIVFIYISSVSSPKERWEAQIKAIGGEQYYFTKSESNYVGDSFGFNGVPSYLIYDKNGKLKHQFTGFPGTEKMREMIDEFLP